jgi:hypothetical protein
MDYGLMKAPCNHLQEINPYSEITSIQLSKADLVVKGDFMSGG